MKIEIEAVEGDRAQLYQWDLNRRLILTGFGQDTQAHFGQDGSALVVEAYEDGGVLYADIPNICLQRAGMLYVYIYSPANTRTRTAAAFSVWARPKPEDYVYTETETLTYRELDERIAKLEESGGADGGYYTPAVDESGNLTWVASKSDMPAVDGANIKGPKGETGPQGPQGEKGEKGDTGDTGPAGPKGDTGDTGPQGIQGQAGSQGPQGEAGAAGADGKDGADGKSAYQYAQDGGYTGTEAEFAAKMAEEIHPGSYPVVTMTADTAELAPNTYYKWGEVLELTITLEAETAGVTNEYCFEFVSGETAATLTAPDTIKWVQEPTIEAGKTYQVSILNGVGVIVGA